MKKRFFIKEAQVADQRLRGLWILKVILPLTVVLLYIGATKLTTIDLSQTEELRYYLNLEKRQNFTDLEIQLIAQSLDRFGKDYEIKENKIYVSVILGYDSSTKEQIATYLRNHKDANKATHTTSANARLFGYDPLEINDLRNGGQA